MSSLSYRPPASFSLVIFAVSSLFLGCSSTEESSNTPLGTGLNSGSGGTLGSGGASGTGAGGNLGSGGGLMGTGGDSSGTGGEGPTITGPSHVTVVAHQDDDLLFINPDLARTISGGTPLATVYLTSGNAGMGMDYVTERELGIRSAYAFMANQPNNWTCTNETYAQKSVATCALNGNADVKLYFLRLVDGWGDGSATGSLKKLWEGAATSSAAVDGSGTSYTRDELIATVTSILAVRSASQIYTTDFTFENRANDHSDHEIAALVALAASGRHTMAHDLSTYVTYSTTTWDPNLSADDTQTVADTFAHYASCDKELDGCSGGVGCDAQLCTTSSSLYLSWTSRHYFSKRVSAGLSATIKSQGAAGLCVGSSGMLTSCAGAGAFSFQSDLTLRSADGLCLTAPSPVTSQIVTVGTCTDDARQKWTPLDNGQILLTAPPVPGEGTSYSIGQCLSASGGNGAPARVESCSGNSLQNWTL